MNDVLPVLLPAPAAYEQLPGCFFIDDAVVIALEAGASQATLNTARNLQQALAEQAGVRILIGAAVATRRIALRVVDQSGTPESYRLEVERRPDRDRRSR